MQMNRNAITMLPGSLSKCTALRSLNLGHNALKAIQGRVYQWYSLREMDVSHNDLQVRPLSRSAHHLFLRKEPRC